MEPERSGVGGGPGVKPSGFADRYGAAIAPSSETSSAESSPRDEAAALDELLDNKAGLKQLKKIAAQLHCVEIVGFFELYGELRRSTDGEDRLILAERMLEKYLRSGASKEVNLEHATRVHCDALYAKVERRLLDDFSVNDVAGAYREVRAMVLSTVWPVYKREKPKKGLLASIVGRRNQ